MRKDAVAPKVEPIDTNIVPLIAPNATPPRIVIGIPGKKRTHENMYIMM
jgi:hypothetical protein